MCHWGLCSACITWYRKGPPIVRADCMDKMASRTYAIWQVWWAGKFCVGPRYTNDVIRRGQRRSWAGTGSYAS